MVHLLGERSHYTGGVKRQTGLYGRGWGDHGTLRQEARKDRRSSGLWTLLCKLNKPLHPVLYDKQLTGSAKQTQSAVYEVRLKKVDLKGWQSKED